MPWSCIRMSKTISCLNLEYLEKGALSLACLLVSSALVLGRLGKGDHKFEVKIGLLWSKTFSQFKS